VRGGRKRIALTAARASVAAAPVWGGATHEGGDLWWTAIEGGGGGKRIRLEMPCFEATVMACFLHRLPFHKQLFSSWLAG